MRMYDLIMKKREGGRLTRKEIDFFIGNYCKDLIPDYQVSALMMAVYFRGMDRNETADLTMAMAESGEMMDLSAIAGRKVDKHSTGGVGDKTTLVLAPMVAAAGVPVAKMSGRGLGHTGGTIDKLESFRGFSAEMTSARFFDNVREHGMAIAAQTADLAPADKKLYALRDVTATVDNISLIASSIMSKKIAGGADSIVLDVKTGSGAFMKDIDKSFDLASEMVEIGSRAGRKTIAIVTDMDQPLGFAVGNILEVEEAIETLKGRGPSDLRELCIALGSHMLVLGGVTHDMSRAEKMLLDVLSSGKALDKMKEFISAQGGDPAPCEDRSLFPEAPLKCEVLSPSDGWVSSIAADTIGKAALVLGAGRETKDSPIDLRVGVVLHEKVGFPVKEGDPLATVYAADGESCGDAATMVEGAFSVSAEKIPFHTLIKGMVRNTGGSVEIIREPVRK